MTRLGKPVEATALFRCYDSHDPRSNVSSEDLTKACKSLLGQIDWSKVALDVVEDETRINYRATVQEALQNQIEAILTEACESNIPGRRRDWHLQEAEETDDSDIHTGSAEAESDDEAYESSFVESDDSEVGSAEYRDSDDSADAGEGEDAAEDLGVVRCLPQDNDVAALYVGIHL